MIRRLLLLPLFSVAVALASQGARIVFATSQGKWVVTQLSSWSIVAPPKSDLITFKFKGGPIKIQDEKGGRTMTAGTAIGKAHKVGGQMMLDRIDLTGGVSAIQKQVAGSIDMKSDSATMTSSAAGEETVLSGDVTVVQTQADGNRVTVEGSSGVIKTKKGLSAVGSLLGPVTMNMRFSVKGAPGTLTATCNNLHFDLSQDPYTVTLCGNVKLKGDQAMYAGESTADEMTIILDKAYQPVEFRGKGGPGTTELSRGTPRR